jgi:hypothetical protein
MKYKVHHAFNSVGSGNFSGVLSRDVDSAPQGENLEGFGLDAPAERSDQCGAGCP